MVSAVENTFPYWSIAAMYCCASSQNSVLASATADSASVTASSAAPTRSWAAATGSAFAVVVVAAGGDHQDGADHHR